MSESDEYPHLDELEEFGDTEACSFTNKQVDQLKRIAFGEEPITSVDIHDKYTDDHAICCNIIVNGIKFAALWIIPEFYADIIYAGRGHEEAKESVKCYISDHIDLIPSVD